MKLGDIHVYVHPDNETKGKLDRILQLLQGITRKEDMTHMTLDELKAQVEQNTAVETSAITLIQGIAAQLTALKSDPAAIQALADTLHASADALSTAITANTPAST